MNVVPEPLPAHVEDLTGRRFGRWIIVGYAGRRDRPRPPSSGGYIQKIRMWFCQCDCGGTTFIQHHNLTKGWSKGCMKCSHEKHGASNTPTYHAWWSARNGLCDSWKLNFTAFFSYLGPKPPGTKLRRHDKGKPHGPGNSYWGQKRQTEGERWESLEVDVEATLNAMRRAYPGLDEDTTRDRLRSVSRQRRHQIRNKTMKESKLIFTTHPVTGPLRNAVKESNGGSLLQIERETGVPLSTVERLMAGGGIRSDSIDALAQHFKMKLKREDE